MKQKRRQKLCHSCEGEVDLDVIFCPFCGSDLLEERAVVEEDPFEPPYSPQDSLQEALTIQKEEEKEEGEVSTSQTLLPIALLSVGTWLFLLGAFLFIFSSDGVATLKLDARYWLVYLLLSVPAIFAGYNFLKKIK